jgi:hypothetical protein
MLNAPQHEPIEASAAVFLESHRAWMARDSASALAMPALVPM